MIRWYYTLHTFNIHARRRQTAETENGWRSYVISKNNVLPWFSYSCPFLERQDQLAGVALRSEFETNVSPEPNRERWGPPP